MKRILYISPSSNPFSVQYGGAQRSNLLLQACMNIGKVDVICFDNLSKEIKQDGFKILYGNYVPIEIKKQSRFKKFFDIFTAWLPEGQIAVDSTREQIIDGFVSKQHYDYIVTRYMHEAISMGLYKYADKLVVDIDDSPIEKARNGIKLAKTLRQRIYMSFYAKMTKIAMQTFLNRIAVSFFSNKNEADIYHSNYLPNIPFYNADTNKLAREKIKEGRLLFVGDLTYAPNYTGLDHFLKEIYPHINREIEFHIVGRIPDEERKKRWNAIPGVSVLGFVDDLLQEYAEAEMVVIPIYFGAGTCIKVLEAMHMQRVLVTTPIGVRGYEEFVSPNKDFLLAHTDKEFIEFIKWGLDNQSLANELINNAKQKINRYFSKEKFFDIVENSMIRKS